MKKIIVFLLALVMIVSMTACVHQFGHQSTDGTDGVSAIPTIATTAPTTAPEVSPNESATWPVGDGHVCDFNYRSQTAIWRSNCSSVEVYYKCNCGNIKLNTVETNVKTITDDSTGYYYHYVDIMYGSFECNGHEPNHEHDLVISNIKWFGGCAVADITLTCECGYEEVIAKSNVYKAITIGSTCVTHGTYQHCIDDELFINGRIKCGIDHQLKLDPNEHNGDIVNAATDDICKKYSCCGAAAETKHYVVNNTCCNCGYTKTE